MIEKKSRRELLVTKIEEELADLLNVETEKKKEIEKIRSEIKVLENTLRVIRNGEYNTEIQKNQKTIDERMVDDSDNQIVTTIFEDKVALRNMLRDFIKNNENEKLRPRDALRDFWKSQGVQADKKLLDRTLHYIKDLAESGSLTITKRGGRNYVSPAKHNKNK